MSRKAPSLDQCPTPLQHRDRIVLGHGSGGRMTDDLIQRFFRPLLDNPFLGAADDSALLPLQEMLASGSSEETLASAANHHLAFSTDSHVVQPLFFPGGDIGRLSICGTVNDLAMVGAQPLWLSAGFILEEGFPTDDLTRIVQSMRAAADEAGVMIVAADTKVAERGKVDGVYINTSGVGGVPAGRNTCASNIRAGDAVIVSGTLGDHGIAVLAARGELAFETQVCSDMAPLNGLVESLFARTKEVHALRDPTRGGLASTLNELARSSGVRIVLQEDAMPVRPQVEAACEMLGFDPLHVANEGKLVAFVAAEQADDALDVMRAHPYGKDACRIGFVEDHPRAGVVMRTAIGGLRVVDTPAGELLPRIC